MSGYQMYLNGKWDDEEDTRIGPKVSREELEKVEGAKKTGWKCSRGAAAEPVVSSIVGIGTNRPSFPG